MRPIKFRAWDKKEKKMYYPKKYTYEIEGTGEKQTDLDMVVFLGRRWSVDRAGEELVGEKCGVLMQFTGLKDSKGIEIYEGDIVEHRSKYQHVAGRFKVIYGDKGEFAGFCLWRVGKIKPRYHRDTGWAGILGSQGHLAKKLKVIGNIYENSELLKGGEKIHG